MLMYNIGENMQQPHVMFGALRGPTIPTSWMVFFYQLLRANQLWCQWWKKAFLHSSWRLSAGWCKKSICTRTLWICWTCVFNLMMLCWLSNHIMIVLDGMLFLGRMCFCCRLHRSISVFPQSLFLWIRLISGFTELRLNIALWGYVFAGPTWGATWLWNGRPSRQTKPLALDVMYW